jgi:hypothetical protein
MLIAKKKWETPLLHSLDGSKVESGRLPIQEGSHTLASGTGSLVGLLGS